MLNQNHIKNIQTLAELAPLLSSSEEEMRFFINQQEDLIRRGGILKANGEFRKIVFVKNDSYRHFLKRLNSFLYSYYSLLTPESIHGFVKNRSIITNAQQHAKKKIVLNVDIKNFFDSIIYEKVNEALMSIGFRQDIADSLTKLVTIDRMLATGFPTSPTLSNIICAAMDRDFQKFAEKHRLVYTRYADDITFSSDNLVPSLEHIKTILMGYGFFLNKNKCRIYRRGGPQYVTGLTVVDVRPRLPRRLKRAIRLELYYIKKFSFLNHFVYILKRGYLTKFSSVVFHGCGLKGFISYINAVEPRLAKKIRRTFRDMDFKHDFSVLE